MKGRVVREKEVSRGKARKKIQAFVREHQLDETTKALLQKLIEALSPSASDLAQSSS